MGDEIDSGLMVDLVSKPSTNSSKAQKAQLRRLRIQRDQTSGTTQRKKLSGQVHKLDTRIHSPAGKTVMKVAKHAGKTVMKVARHVGKMYRIPMKLNKIKLKAFYKKERKAKKVQRKRIAIKRTNNLRMRMAKKMGLGVGDYKSAHVDQAVAAMQNIAHAKKTIAADKYFEKKKEAAEVVRAAKMKGKHVGEIKKGKEKGKKRGKPRAVIPA